MAELVAPGTSGARWNDYLSVGNVKVGVRFTDVTSQTVSTRYFHTDHLGSVAVITDENGMVVERLSYDAWGKRRFANGADDPAGSIESLTTRGFTGHEELDSVGLVHMNGRVYDPLVGRMMSPDPTVPDALNAQAWNRYSYVGNDPLTFTDPSGYSWLSSFFHSIGNAVSSLFQRVPILRAVVQIAVAALLSFTGVGVVVAAAASAAIVNGLSGGNLGTMLRAGAIAGATAFAFNVVGSATNAVAGYDPSGPHITPQFGTPEYAFNVAGHAGVGCLTSVASGGSCQSGALSGAAGAAASPLIPGNLIGGTAVSGVVGGLASVAGGGKFENGAVTAAFGYLFNQAAHSGSDTNERHQMGVDAAMKDYVERGYAVIQETSVAVNVPGFATPRFYDFIAEDPISGYNVGVEVKTTLYDTIRLNAAQVAKDVVVMQQGGYSPLLRLSVNGVGYTTYCWGCGTVDFRSTALYSTLKSANIPFTHGGKPGEIRP
jgi:RHS repeat-associated protein